MPRFPAMAAVLDDDLTGAWLTGPDVPADPSRLRYVDAPEMAALADVAAWAAALGLGFEHEHTRPDDGQVWVPPAAAARLGLPDRLPEDKAAAKLVAPLKAAGWNVSHTEAWVTLWRPGGRSLRLAVVPWMSPARVPLVAGDPDPYGLAFRLAAYAAHVGLPLRMSAGVTGVDLMERLRPPGSRLGLAEPVTAPPPARRRTLESAYLWQRRPTSAELAMAYVHAYDKNGQYLAAASSVALGLADAEHWADAPEFNPKLPGLWRVAWASVPWNEPGLPDLFNPTSRGRKGADAWHATPTLVYAASIGYEITPLEAYVYPQHGRALEPWYRRLRAARESLAPDKADPDLGPVLATLKATYAAGLGRLDAANTKGDRRYRPDWYAAVRSTARANLTRNVLAAVENDHRYPLAVIKDQVLYASDDPDPVSACPPSLRLGAGLGAWKVYGTAPMAEAAARLHPGRPVGRGGVMELFAGEPGEE